MYNINWYCFCAFSFSVSTIVGATICDAAEAPQVALSTGCVEGLKLTTVLGRTYYSFRGIPYAAPPIGDLRFKAPQTLTNWSGVLHAREDAPACLQPWRQVPFPITYSEDCLYLNVFTPYLKSDAHTSGKLMPVIVWIHGGGFYRGSGSSYKYGTDFLLMKDVVVVFINYRLGVFGYLNMNVTEAQGNAAMKDMVAALRWVQKEISKFGGDPSLVTITGDSSGSGCVYLLYNSPMAKGLFSRAIAESGSGLCEWSFLPSTSSYGLRLAEALGCPTHSPQATVSCLREVDGVALAEKQMMFPGAEGVTNPFLPSIESDLGEEVFLSNSPLEITSFAEGVPYLTGTTSGEGLKDIKDPETNPDQFEKVNKDFISYLPVHMLQKENPEVLLDISIRLKEFYIGSNSSLNNTIYGFINYMSDRQVSYCVVKAAQLITTVSPVYLYYFTYDGDFKRNGWAYNKLNLSGVDHGGELEYLFYRPCYDEAQNNISLHPREMAMVETMVSLWTNFAAYGNPTPRNNNLNITWYPVEEEFTRHLIIGDPLEMASYPLLEDRMALWDSIYASLLGKVTSKPTSMEHLVYIVVYFFLLFSAILGIFCYFKSRKQTYNILD